MSANCPKCRSRRIVRSYNSIFCNNCGARISNGEFLRYNKVDLRLKLHNIFKNIQTIGDANGPA
jgi:ribosomal protein L37AE/L43A